MIQPVLLSGDCRESQMNQCDVCGQLFPSIKTDSKCFTVCAGFGENSTSLVLPPIIYNEIAAVLQKYEHSITEETYYKNLKNHQIYVYQCSRESPTSETDEEF